MVVRTIFERGAISNKNKMAYTKLHNNIMRDILHNNSTPISRNRDNRNKLCYIKHRFKQT